MTTLSTVRRRVSAKAARMTLTECEDWWSRWVEASAAGDSIATGVMTSAMTGCSEPSRSQCIRSMVKRKVYEKMMKLRRNT